MIKHSQRQQRNDDKCNCCVTAAEEPSDGDSGGSEQRKCKSRPGERKDANQHHNQHRTEVLRKHQTDVLPDAGGEPAFMEVLVAAPKCPKASEQTPDDSS